MSRKQRTIRDFPSWVIIIRAISMRGADQSAALAELTRRGLWLSEDQKRQAGLLP